MDSIKEFSIFLDDSDLDSDSRADIEPPPPISSETEDEEPTVPKTGIGQGNSIGARIQALTLFEL
jgi:hypothetical protein